MDDPVSLLRQLPQVDKVLSVESIASLSGEVPRSLLAETVRRELASLREKIRAGELTATPDAEAVAAMAASALKNRPAVGLRAVINATGVTLHTNLGRAPLSERALKAVQTVAAGYSNLEYSLEKGARGSRHTHIEGLLCDMLPAEAAMVVNNNAAGSLLCLSALVSDGEVVVSRGELVEIGGSFRIPDICAQSGAVAVEVGTTNKTRLSDYEKAIGERTRALLKVHTSNFRIVGFTESVPVSALRTLADAHDLPVLYDLGSGMLGALPGIPPEEPTVEQAMRDGADVVLFSGDKLLGGPQAGIVVGKKEYIERMKAHPLARALRVDKMTIAALYATLLDYRDMRAASSSIPTLKMITATPVELYEKALKLQSLLQQEVPELQTTVEAEDEPVGGGAAPGALLPGWHVRLHTDGGAEKLTEGLRRANVPVVAAIRQDSVCLHLRTVREEELPLLAASVRQAAAFVNGSD